MVNCAFCISPIDDSIDTEYSPAHQECSDAYKGGRSMNLCIVCGSEPNQGLRVSRLGVYCRQHKP